MNIFLAGATGALGKPLTRALVAARHHVHGTTRSRPEEVSALGAVPVVLDALDRDAVRAAVLDARPEVVVHQLTAIGKLDARHPDKSFAATNRLRTEGIDILLDAAREAGARRFVAQSFAGWPYARTGPRAKDEAATLDPAPPKGLRATHAAIRHLETAVLAADGIVLRYGGFYGPGTSMAPGGDQYEAVRARKMPLPGEGSGIWSLVHVDDAAAATVAAIERGQPGIYNVVDDEPAPVREWIPALADAIGAAQREPRRAQRQGPPRARLAARPPQLAPGLRLDDIRARPLHEDCDT